jgi:hypothetical protein
MIEIEFEYKQNKVMIQAKSYESFQSVIDKYIQKSQIQLDSVYFIANGNKIKPERSLESIMTNIDKRNKKIKVLVNKIQDKDNNCQEVIVKSKNIICPKCGEKAKLNIQNYNISLYDCLNGHEFNNLSFEQFEKTQNIDLSKIICDKCQNNDKSTSYDNKFFICGECKMNLCPIVPYVKVIMISHILLLIMILRIIYAISIMKIM